MSKSFQDHVPKIFRDLGPSVPFSIRRATEQDDIDDVMTFSQYQTEAQQQSQFARDKINAVRVIVAKIEKIKVTLKTARKDLRRQLKKELVSLEAQERELLKDEIALAKSGQLKRPRLFADLD